MKTIKKTLSSLLVVIMIFTVIPVIGIRSKAAYTGFTRNESQVLSVLDSIRKEFPEGSYFTQNGKACSQHNALGSCNNNCELSNVLSRSDVTTSVSNAGISKKYFYSACWTCQAYASYCYTRCFGVPAMGSAGGITASNYYTVLGSTNGGSSVSDVEFLLSKAKAGDLLVIKNSSGIVSHWFVFYSHTSSGFNYQDNNGNAPLDKIGTVRFGSYTYDDFTTNYLKKYNYKVELRHSKNYDDSGTVINNKVITWNSISASNITSTSAVVRADVTANTSAIDTIGLQMWKDGESAKSVASWSVGNTLTYCSVACDGTEAPKLSAGTKYNYRFYIVKTDGSYDYSGTKSFTTSSTAASAISWDKLSVSNKTATSAVIRADVTAKTSLINTIGLQMWKDGESAKSVASWPVNSVLTYCSVACDGTEAPKLSPSTKYNYRFYIVRTDGTYEYSSTGNFTTSASTASVISWDKIYVSNLKETSAEVKADVTANTSVINTIGLQMWKEGESVKSVASWKVNQILNYCYVKCDGSEAPKLSPGTKYYYRFYIIKTDGTYIYSPTSTFTTPCSHTYNSGSVTTSATCTSNGVKIYTCTKCGATKAEAISALGHSYSTTVVASTCTEQGYTIHQCSRCTAGYKDSYTAVISHEYNSGVVIVEPTYEKEGIREYCCKNCDVVKTESIPKLVPSNYTITFNANGGSCSTANKTVMYNSTYGTLPTPTRSGYTFDGWYTSSTGGTKVTSSTKYTTEGNTTLYAHWTASHVHSYTGKVTKEATCTAAGTKTYTCSCSATYTEAIPATGHNYGAWTVTKAATTSAEGTETRTCLNCGHKETRSIPRLNPVVKEETVNVHYKQSMTITGNDIKSIVSSNTQVAVVSDNQVRTVGIGSATVTATFEDGSQYIVHINSSYAWWQWIIVIVLFGWMWY